MRFKLQFGLPPSREGAVRQWHTFRTDRNEVQPESRTVTDLERRRGKLPCMEKYSHEKGIENIMDKC